MKPEMAQPQPLPPTSNDPNSAADGTPPLYGFFVGCGILTAVVWLNMVVQFFAQSSALDHASGLNTLYLMLLGLYSGAKHVTPPAPDQQDTRVIRGSFFVWLWVGTCAVMYLFADNGWFGLHKTPHDLLAVTGGVFAIFLGAKAAKAFIPRGRGAAFKMGGATSGRTVPAPAPVPAPDPDPPPQDPILVLLANCPPEGLTNAQIAKRLDISPITVRRKMRPLIDADLVEKISEGPNDPQTRYRLKRPDSYGPAPDRPQPAPRPVPDYDGSGDGGATTSDRNVAFVKRVLALLATSRQGFTFSQIDSRLQSTGDLTLTKTLDGLIARREIGTVGTGPSKRYVLAEFLDYA